jgi:hypothetical protein
MIAEINNTFDCNNKMVFSTPYLVWVSGELCLGKLS